VANEKKITIADLPPLISYADRAKAAAKRLTPEYVKRARQIQKRGAAQSLDEAVRLFETIISRHATVRRWPETDSDGAVRVSRNKYDEHGLKIAIEICEAVAVALRGRLPPKAPGKQRGAHDPGRDKTLLELWLAAKRDELPGETSFTEQEFAQWLVDTPEGRVRWGASSAQQILRRLKYLRKNSRTK
jgi:hypothetical protein